MNYNYKKEPTEIDGLSFFPRLIDYGMDIDCPPYSDSFYGNPINEVSQAERDELRNVTWNYVNKPINIVEIGIHRNGEGSFTKVLLDKHPDSKYLGIDIDDKSFLNDSSNNIHTLKTDSANQELIRKTLSNLGMESLTILFIDGWHSVNMAINDWRYSDLVVSGGYVVTHDVHMHPGPRVLMDAIDRTKYKVTVPLEKMPGNYGIGIARKL